MRNEDDKENQETLRADKEIMTCEGEGRQEQNTKEEIAGRELNKA